MELRFTAKFKRTTSASRGRARTFPNSRRPSRRSCAERICPKRCAITRWAGRTAGDRECHIEPDLLFVYRIDEDGLVLVATRTGSHGELLEL